MAEGAVSGRLHNRTDQRSIGTMKFLTASIVELIEQAAGVCISDCDLHENAWQRYSSHQDCELRTEGFMGKVTYQGNLRPYLPLLAAGELLHLGKATVFGQGLYQLQSL